MDIDRRTMLAGLTAAPLAAPFAMGQRVTVYEAARIVTMEQAQPRARFVAVAGGIVLGLADSLEALSPWTVGRDVHVDRSLAGKVLFPGLVDPHVHPMQGAVMLGIPFVAPDEWNLPSGHYPGALTGQAWRERVKAEMARSKADPFICWGHHELFHGPLDRAALDALEPSRAVVIWQRSFHEVIVNSATLKAWGLDTPEAFAAAMARAQADPGHGDLARGHFAETALPIALEKMRPTILTPARLAKGMVDLKQVLLKSGVTTISDMATGIFAPFEAEAGLIRQAFERDDCPARIMLMPIATNLAAESDPLGWLAAARGRHAGQRVLLERRVKFLADGAFFAQNMRMNSPGYSDGHQGKWIMPPELIGRLLPRFWDLGFNAHIHVNGDEGLDVVLGAIEALGMRKAQTITLEHVGYSTEAQNRRIARLGLMVSAQPNYIRVLGDAYAKSGLGPDRAAAMNRLGSLERKQVPLGLHSDFNMAPIDPFYLAWIAATRRTIGGNIKAPAERLSLDKALRAVTIEAAQVVGLDHMVGSIASGKRADFAVLDRDPYDAGVKGLRGLKPQGVVFEGTFYPA